MKNIRESVPKPWINKPNNTVTKYKLNCPAMAPISSISKSFEVTRKSTPIGDVLKRNKIFEYISHSLN